MAALHNAMLYDADVPVIEQRRMLRSTSELPPEVHPPTGAGELLVEVLWAEGLVEAEYRFGDLTKWLVTKATATDAEIWPYVEVVCGQARQRTESVKTSREGVVRF